MSIIEVKNLHHRYDSREVLQSINLSIERGEVFALIGPTGAGKTTLLRVIDLLEPPSSGEIYFNGQPVAGGKQKALELRRRMAMVFQKPVVFRASIRENVASGLKWRRQPKSVAKEKVERALDMVGLLAAASRQATDLSGGEVQRVAIARAIVVEPEVLLLDEPTANLDPLSSREVEALLSRIVRQLETTVIMATHDMSQGQRLADRAAVLIDGQIRQAGEIAEVFSYPQSRRVAELVGMENLLDGTVVSSEGGVVAVDIGGHTLEAVSDYGVGEVVSAGIRPENVTLTLSGNRSSARNSFTGEITGLATASAVVRVELYCGFPLVALVTARSVAELGLEAGKQVQASFKATGVRVISRRD